MEFALNPHFPSTLFHLDSQLINELADTVCPFLLLGILESLAARIGVSGIDDWDRIGQRSLGAKRLVHEGLLERPLGMKAIDGHAKMVRVVVLQDGDPMRTLRLDKVLSQFHRSIKDLKRRLPFL